MSDRVLTQWVISCKPFLWNKRTRDFVKNERFSGLIAYMREQVVSALAQDWSEAQLIEAIRYAKNDNYTGHLFSELLGVYGSRVQNNVLSSSEEYTHHALFVDGVILPSFMLDDVLLYAEHYPAPDREREDLLAIIHEHGLDLVLYAIDCFRNAREQRFAPYKLRAYIVAARTLKNDTLALRRSAYKTNALFDEVFST